MAQPPLVAVGAGRRRSAAGSALPPAAPSLRARPLADQPVHVDQAGREDDPVDDDEEDQRRRHLPRRNRRCGIGGSAGCRSPATAGVRPRRRSSRRARRGSRSAMTTRRAGGRSATARAAPATTRMPPQKASTSMMTPRPTMMRKPKNGSSTGGRSSAAKSFRPCKSAVERPGDDEAGEMRHRNLVEVRAPASSSGMANSTSGTGPSMPASHFASIAASLAGWYCSTSRPDSSPAMICRGTSTTARPSPILSMVSACGLCVPASR